MLTEHAALELLRKYISDEGRISHSIGVAEFAFSLASKIHAEHPELAIDPVKVKTAALLHDIGRGRGGDHELAGVEILRNEGQSDLAAIIIHGSIYEITLLRGKPDTSLIPATIENKIVAYSDTRFKDRPMSMKERWSEIEARRSKDLEKIS
jgi:putative nucleotidyltransferase with HDIG domain